MTVGTGVVNSVDGVKWGANFGHENGIAFSVTAGAELTSMTDGDEAIQDLIDYLAAWPKLHPTNGVSAGRTLIYGYPITVTEEP